MKTPRTYLDQLGWEPAQIDLFIALTTHGEQTVLQLSRIVARPRSTLYLELGEMLSKGLVTVKKIGKRTIYKAIAIQAIKNIVQDKSAEFSQLLGSFDEFVRQIKGDEHKISNRYDVVTYKGQDGIKQLLWNILTSDAKEVVGFSPGTLEHVVDRDFAEKWRAEFKARGKHNRIIVNKTVPLTWSNVPNFLTKKYVEVRTLEAKKITFAHEVWFYGDVLVVISTKDDPEQYGVEITDRLLVSSYRQLFDLLWNEVARKVK